MVGVLPAEIPMSKSRLKHYQSDRCRDRPGEDETDNVQVAGHLFDRHLAINAARGSIRHMVRCLAEFGAPLGVFDVARG